MQFSSTSTRGPHTKQSHRLTRSCSAKALPAPPPPARALPLPLLHQGPAHSTSTRPGPASTGKPHMPTSAITHFKRFMEMELEDILILVENTWNLQERFPKLSVAKQISLHLHLPWTWRSTLVCWNIPPEKQTDAQTEGRPGEKGGSPYRITELWMRPRSHEAPSHTSDRSRASKPRACWARAWSGACVGICWTGHGWGWHWLILSWHGRPKGHTTRGHLSSTVPFQGNCLIATRDLGLPLPMLPPISAPTPSAVQL